MSSKIVCATCEQEIKPCASCCRHTGWVHKGDGSHHSDEPSHHYARPKLYVETFMTYTMSYCPNAQDLVREELA